MGPDPYRNTMRYVDLYEGNIVSTATPDGPEWLLDLFQPGTQCRRLLERLLRGPVYNHEIRDLGILNHSGRISDVRREIRRHGWDVVGEQILKGRWEYRLVRMPVIDRQPTWWERFKNAFKEVRV